MGIVEYFFFLPEDFDLDLEDDFPPIYTPGYLARPLVEFETLFCASWLRADVLGANEDSL